MATTDPTREGTTTTADDIRFPDFALCLIEYAMHASPERTDQMLRQAYSDLVPGSAARSQALDDDLAGRPRGTGPVRRRLAQDKAQRWSTCAYERCSQVFEWEWPATHKQFCSPRCQRSAARRRERLRVDSQPTGDPVQVAAEMAAALANLGALVAEQEAGR